VYTKIFHKAQIACALSVTRTILEVSIVNSKFILVPESSGPQEFEVDLLDYDTM
jgi:hypothetical protein